jgi:DICT domain-containing protein
MPTYTLTLDEETAKRLAEIVKTFGGSIPNFARLLTSDVAALPIEEIQKVRNELAMRAAEHRRKPAKGRERAG